MGIPCGLRPGAGIGTVASSDDMLRIACAGGSLGSISGTCGVRSRRGGLRGVPASKAGGTFTEDGSGAPISAGGV